MNDKKAILTGLDWQKNNFTRASRFFVHFFAISARLRQENGENVKARQGLSFSFPELR